MAEELVCDRHGVAFHMDLKRAMLGSSIERAGALLADWVGLPAEQGPQMGQELLVAYREVVDQHGVKPLPGVIRMLDALADRIPVAVASNTNEVDTRRVLAASGVPWVFNAIVCAGGTIPPKPAPDLYLAACAALDSAPAQCVAFEDSPLGAAAALAAGMYVIGIPSTEGVTLDTHRVVASMEAIDLADLLGAP